MNEREGESSPKTGGGIPVSSLADWCRANPHLAAMEIEHIERLREENRKLRAEVSRSSYHCD